MARCSACDLTSNLWLCLTCGNFGCGRQQHGGSAGNGHGLRHFEDCGHPVNVKMGTITAEGTAGTFDTLLVGSPRTQASPRRLLLRVQRRTARSQASRTPRPLWHSDGDFTED